jgi:hypothetical protein
MAQGAPAAENDMVLLARFIGSRVHHRAENDTGTVDTALAAPTVDATATESATAPADTATAAPGDGASASAAAANADSTESVSATASAAPAESSGAAADTGDPQTSLTLDPSVIAKGFANDGQDVPTAGQVASLTSTNNFINFCATVNVPLTDGKQIPSGSCDPAPMGVIPSSDNMPSAKFTFPLNFGQIEENKPFTIKLALQNFDTGFFVNAQQNYFAAPQVLNGGLIQGHSHVVVQLLDSLQQTTPADPKVFAFFKGLNAKSNGGVLTADVANGLPAGVYRLASINTASNHQPVLVPIAQHGSLDDFIYFTVTAGGAAAQNGTAAAGADPSGTATASDVATQTGEATATATGADAIPTDDATATGTGGQTDDPATETDTAGQTDAATETASGADAAAETDKATATAA